MAQTAQQRAKDVHQHLAADRLIKQGKTLDEVNQYLQSTTHEQRVQENNAHALEQERKQNQQ
tara:strand:+ start:208 stop:393 length:186 start_codon:yes stop_codon:yes gene_type:complete